MAFRKITKLNVLKSLEGKTIEKVDITEEENIVRVDLRTIDSFSMRLSYLKFWGIRGWEELEKRTILKAKICTNKVIFHTNGDLGEFILKIYTK